MARAVKLAPVEKSEPKAKQVVAPSRLNSVRSYLPTILGAAALVAAGALAGTALAHGGRDGGDGHRPGHGMEARIDHDGDQMGGDMGPGGMPGPDRDHDGGGPDGAGGHQAGPELTGTVTSATSSQLVVAISDGTSQTVALDAASQLFVQTSGTAADVTVGSYVLVDAGMPIGNSAGDAAGIAVLADGLTDAHVHLGRPAKVTAMNGSELTLEFVTPQGTSSIKVNISTTTSISKVATATIADLTVGSSVVVDYHPGALTAGSVLIVK